MTQFLSRLLAGAFVALAFAVAGAETRAQDNYGGYTNYVAQPGHPAALYPSPIYVPPNVGWTYITYAPLAPHEFLYTHAKLVRRKNPCTGGYTDLSVRYGHCPQNCCDGHSTTHPAPPARLPSARASCLPF